MIISFCNGYPSLIIVKAYVPEVAFWKETKPVAFVMANRVDIPAGCEVEETIALFNGFPVASLMKKVNVPVAITGEGVGVGVGVEVALEVGVGVESGVGVGVGVGVGAGAGVTVTCVVPWAFRYPVFTPVAVIVQVVDIEKLGAVN